MRNLVKARVHADGDGALAPDRRAGHAPSCATGSRPTVARRPRRAVQLRAPVQRDRAHPRHPRRRLPAHQAARVGLRPRRREDRHRRGRGARRRRRPRVRASTSASSPRRAARTRATTCCRHCSKPRPTASGSPTPSSSPTASCCCRPVTRRPRTCSATRRSRCSATPTSSRCCATTRADEERGRGVPPLRRLGADQPPRRARRHDGRRRRRSRRTA